MRSQYNFPAGRCLAVAKPTARSTLITLLLCFFGLAPVSHADTVMFDTTSEYDTIYPSGAFNIWWACTGRGAAFQVEQDGFVSSIDLPLINWQGNARGDLVVELMADVVSPVMPGHTVYPGEVLEEVVHQVADWSAFQRGVVSVEFSGATYLEAGITYWLGVSLSERIPDGLAGLGWVTNAHGETSKLVSRFGMPTDPTHYWYESRFVETHAFRVMAADVVPLPGAVWLLLSALGVAGWLGRGKENATGN